MVNKEATTKKDKDSQSRRYSVQPREDSRTGGSRQNERRILHRHMTAAARPAFVAIKGATD